MKVLAETSLRELLRLIKTNFFRKSEAQEVSTIGIDDAPADGSDNLVKSGGVFNALAGKQGTISDLATIRSGAAKGATAMQEDDVYEYLSDHNYATNGSVFGIVENAVSTKQDIITDLATIRSNASSGASKVSCTDAQVGSYGYIKLSDLPIYNGGVS